MSFPNSPSYRATLDVPHSILQLLLIALGLRRRLSAGNSNTAPGSTSLAWNPAAVRSSTLASESNLQNMLEGLLNGLSNYVLKRTYMMKVTIPNMSLSALLSMTESHLKARCLSFRCFDNIVVGAIIFKFFAAGNHKLLLLKRAAHDPAFPNRFAIPGGRKPKRRSWR